MLELRSTGGKPGALMTSTGWFTKCRTKHSLFSELILYLVCDPDFIGQIVSLHLYVLKKIILLYLINNDNTNEMCNEIPSG